MSRQKKITVNQAMQGMNQFYLGVEAASLAALEITLSETLGVGKKRFERVRAVYIQHLLKEAEKQAEAFRKQSLRRAGK